MCVIALAHRVHPAYPLIIVSNRDEFYNRPTAPLDYWKDNPEILAGRDLKSFGTWMGVTKKGKIAALTNYREFPGENETGNSRGMLVSDYLANDIPPEIYLKTVARNKNRYSGFNIIAGTPGALFWYSNRNRGIEVLPPGIHTVSNHLLNTPWPKARKIQRTLSALIAGSPCLDDMEILFRILKDDTKPPRNQLPNTGIGEAWEKILSPIFITSEIYGTRSSSVILLHNDGKIRFCERTFEAGEAFFTRCFEFYPAAY